MTATTATLRSGGVDGLPGFDRDVVDERERALDLHRRNSPGMLLLLHE